MGPWKQASILFSVYLSLCHKVRIRVSWREHTGLLWSPHVPGFLVDYKFSTVIFSLDSISVEGKKEKEACIIILMPHEMKLIDMIIGLLMSLRAFKVGNLLCTIVTQNRERQFSKFWPHIILFKPLWRKTEEICLYCLYWLLLAYKIECLFFHDIIWWRIFKF